MSGCITKKAVLAHTIFIIKKYGISFYICCLTCKNETFLSLLMKKGKI